MNLNRTKIELAELSIVGGGKWHFIDILNIVILEI